MNNPSDTFRQEATELLESLEENLLELEADPTSRSMIDTVFRALHTIKGSGEMFGFSQLAKFVHKFENAFDRVRSGETDVTPELIDISLTSRDHIAALLAAGQDEAATKDLVESDLHGSLLSRIAAYVSDDSTNEVSKEKVAEKVIRNYSIFFRPEPAALRNGMRPDLISEELSMLGECSAKIIADQIPPLEELDPASCYLAWQISLTADCGTDKIEEVFLFFDDGEVVITELENDITESVEPGAPKTMESDETGDAKPSGAAQTEARASGRDPEESVRVQAHRLDELMDQLGELVIAQARLNRISERLNEPGLASAAEEIERLVTGMRDATLSIRMLPIGGVFAKFRRVVRDLANELGKSVTLITEGGETELDKNIIDRLADPLVHIIRNAVDHGIEDASEREAVGKPPNSTVRMVARQTGGEVHISVIDDGGGLKTQAIRERALARGLIDPEIDVSDEAVHQLIFAPGFSTAEVVSNVSGRGVGMDAVRGFIEDLRGAVDVKSEAGVGTTVTLRLPLTLAIIDGLQIQVGQGDFVIPLASVEECVEFEEQELSSEQHRSIITIREELIPYLRLDNIFGFGSSKDLNRMVIVNADGRRVGLMVEEVIGQHQTVIKSLSTFHRGVEGLAGCTILGDGSVALIIDPAALVKGYGNTVREAA